MRSLVLLAVFVTLCAGVANVVGQPVSIIQGAPATLLPGEDEAIMTSSSKPAASNLKKPIIYDPTPVDPNAPIVDPITIGTPPPTLKAPVITDNIFGGAVEWENATTPFGCPCKRLVPSKYRYDSRFYKPQVNITVGCGCPWGLNLTNTTDPAAALPPVVARLYPLPLNVTITPWNSTLLLPPQPRVRPHYYQRVPTLIPITPVAGGLAVVAPTGTGPAVPCLNPLQPPPQRIQPTFYGETRAQRLARLAALQP